MEGLEDPMQPSVHLVHFAQSGAPMLTPVLRVVRRLCEQKGIWENSATTSSGATASKGHLTFPVRLQLQTVLRSGGIEVGPSLLGPKRHGKDYETFAIAHGTNRLRVFHA